MDCGLNKEKLRASLTKVTREGVSSNLTARIWAGFVLIASVGLKSSGSGDLGAREAAPSPETSVSRRRPRRSSAKGAAGLDSTRVRVRERACVTASSSGRTRGRVGALTWLAAAPGGVARPQARRRAIARRSEGKQGVKEGSVVLLPLRNA